jgi:hypothetical protein
LRKVRRAMAKKFFTDEEIDNQVTFLKETLIPDLRDSGSDATADDFDTCVSMIEFLLSELETLQTK